MASDIDVSQVSSAAMSKVSHCLREPPSERKDVTRICECMSWLYVWAASALCGPIPGWECDVLVLLDREAVAKDVLNLAILCGVLSFSKDMVATAVPGIATERGSAVSISTKR